MRDLEIKVAPLKDVTVEDKKVDKRDIKILHQQLNYSNTVLETMSKRLTRIENKNCMDMPSSSKFNGPIKSSIQPIYKLNNVPQKDLEAIRFKSDMVVDI